MHNFIQIIRALKVRLNSAPTVFFGAGGLGKAFLKYAKEQGFSPAAFIDSDPRKVGTSVDGISVLTIEDALKLTPNIVITNSYHTETRSQLDGYASGLILHAKAAAMALSSDSDLFFESLMDDESKSILTGLLDYFIGNEPVPKRSNYRQYMHPSLDMSRLKTIIDAGAYDGATFHGFQQHCPDNMVAYLFEPIPENQRKIEMSVGAHKQALLKNMGLWSRPTTLYFNEDKAASSVQTNSQAGMQLPVVALDDLALDIDLLKMDIEGAELEALLGSVETIKRCQPNLAISIYHSFLDFVLLPKMIRDMLPDHHFFLGQHNCFPAPSEAFYEYETVFYAFRPSDLR